MYCFRKTLYLINIAAGRRRLAQPLPVGVRSHGMRPGRCKASSRSASWACQTCLEDHTDRHNALNDFDCHRGLVRLRAAVYELACENFQVQYHRHETNDGRDGHHVEGLSHEFVQSLPCVEIVFVLILFLLFDGGLRALRSLRDLLCNISEADPQYVPCHCCMVRHHRVGQEAAA